VILSVNGVEKLNHLDTSPSYTSGKVGVYGGNWASGSYVDDVQVTGRGPLVDEDFNDGVADGWNADASGWSVVNNEYKFVGAGTAKYSTAGDTTWQDYSVSARVKLTNNNWHRTGLMFYTQSDNTGYRIEFAPSDTYNVTAYLKEGTTDIASVNLGMNFQSYRDVDIDVSNEGGDVRVILSVNGVEKLNHLDTSPSYTSGKVGVSGASWAAGSYVDDVLVLP
jgi:hypothetical protein